jgi:hypothetical protein
MECAYYFASLSGIGIHHRTKLHINLIPLIRASHCFVREPEIGMDAAGNRLKRMLGTFLSGDSGEIPSIFVGASEVCVLQGAVCPDVPGRKCLVLAKKSGRRAIRDVVGEA